MQFSKLVLIVLFLSHSATAIAQSLPIDDFGFDSPVVESTEPLLPFQFSLLGPSQLQRSVLFEKIESIFAQVGCELAEVKIVKRSLNEIKLSSLSADCEAPKPLASPGRECRSGFELVRISFVDSNLRLTNALNTQADNQFCVRVSL